MKLERSKRIINNLLTGLGVVFVALAIIAILWGGYEGSPLRYGKDIIQLGSIGGAILLQQYQHKFRYSSIASIVLFVLFGITYFISLLQKGVA